MPHNALQQKRLGAAAQGAAACHLRRMWIEVHAETPGCEMVLDRVQAARLSGPRKLEPVRSTSQENLRSCGSRRWKKRPSACGVHGTHECPAPHLHSMRAAKAT